MAIFHMNMNIISRGKGQSATASAAYRSGEKLYSERYDKTSNYHREIKPDAFILSPKNAPEWTNNRERLWNEVEKIEKANSSQLAREFTVALPIELNNDEQKELIREYVQHNFVDEGMVADISIHRDKEKNPHAHVMLTMRPFLDNGEWGKKATKKYKLDEKGNKTYYKNGEARSSKKNTTNWNNKSTFKNWRKKWAKYTNITLEKFGFSERITEKSFADLAIDKIPTIHEGHVARSMEENGKISERMEENRDIKQKNYDNQKEKKEFAQKEIEQNISDSLSPKEKGRISSLVKSLGVYVNFENLLDKTRMVNNWNNKIKFNQVIKPDEDFSEVLGKIDDTKDSIKEASNIINKQHLRIFEKYYSEINEKYNLSDFKKIHIAVETLDKDKVLDDNEFNQSLLPAQDNELNCRLREIVHNPTGNYSIKNIQKTLAGTNKQIDILYKEHNITSKEELSQLDEPTQNKAQKLFSKQDTQFNLLNTLNDYYSERILTEYPTVELKELSVRDKETVVDLMNYYGNRYSFDKILDIAENKIPTKYTTAERNIGMSFIYKIDNNQMTDNDLEMIEKNPDIKEIFETIQDPRAKKQFLKEYQENNFENNNFYSSYFSDNRSGLDFSRLAKGLNIVNTLSNANIDNLVREQEGKRRERELENKKSKSVKNKKGKKKGNTKGKNVR